MSLVVKIFCFFLGVSSLSLFAEIPTHHDYLEGKVTPEHGRYETMQLVLQLIEEMGAQTLVETGTARDGTAGFTDGDGGSTIIFAEWARDHGAEFFSVDISQKNLKKAQEAVKRTVVGHENKVHFICSDSVAYLRDFNQPIDFLYLDSYDFDPDNPGPSQHHHLREIRAAYPFLTKNSIVMIDDCNLVHGGKGKLAIEFLLQHGWKIVCNRYQVILTRE